MNDLTGKKFNQLTVLGYDRKVGNNAYWHCRCDCGKVFGVRGCNLKPEGTKSCGHKTDSIHIGKKYGRLTVLSESKTKYGTFVCQCDCGNTTEVFSSNLSRNHTTSCGCYRIEVSKAVNTTHGMRHTDEYTAWYSMKQRCYDINCEAYKDYGGRGIRVCARWFESFENFYADMGDKPSKRHSLDRFPDTNGDYEKSNCRWGTKRQQAQNRRYNVKVTYRGEVMVLSEFARRFNISGTKAYYHHSKNRSPKEILEFYNIKDV